ncbi:hypothetical protein ACE1TI_03610 [Alteribacillus sp. JSM 102045]|uniref:hypothetical protein n=1 Tax=Alteribacillus sp. JSM 102045 TaxID=1562101 RepID=UPI0035BF3C0D
MAEKDKHYFAGDYTAKGFYPLYTTNFQGLDLVIKLTGVSSSVKSEAMKKIAEEWQRKGFSIEWIHCSSNNEALDGIIFPDLKIGIYDSACGDISLETVSEAEINTDDEFLRKERLADQDNTINRYHHRINRAFQSSLELFKTGLFVHDDLEDIYIKNMDFAKADQLAIDVKKQLYRTLEPTGKNSITKHRFFGASTPNGVIDYIPNLTEDLGKRYFIKGRAGTGKSTLLRKLAAPAEKLGFDVEMYHCGFDPESMDMLIVRELDFCVFDSTDPHEYLPEKDSDEIIDLYKKTVVPGTDEKYEKEINKLTAKYKSYMKKGGVFLKKAKRNKEELDQIYRDAMKNSVIEDNFQIINEKVKQQANRLQ